MIGAVETGCRTGLGLAFVDDDDDDDDGLEVGFGVDVGTMSSGFVYTDPNRLGQMVLKWVWHLRVHGLKSNWVVDISERTLSWNETV